MIITVVFALIAIYLLYKRYTSKPIELDGKTVVITGASSGIGTGLVSYLKDYQVTLFICSRSMDALEKTKEALIANTFISNRIKTIHCVQLDLRDEKSIDNAVKTIESYGKKIDILINNAGVSSRQLAIESPLSVYRDIMEVNYFGTVSFTLKLLENNMIEKTMGTIVTIGSIQSIIGTYNRSAYASSKFALLGFFDSLRAEIKSTYGNVRVVTVHPSYVATNLSLNAITSTGEKYNVMDEKTKNGMSIDYVADCIFDCVLDRSATQELIISPSFTIRLAVLLRHIFPNLIFMQTQHANN